MTDLGMKDELFGKVVQQLLQKGGSKESSYAHDVREVACSRPCCEFKKVVK